MMKEMFRALGVFLVAYVLFFSILAESGCVYSDPAQTHKVNALQMWGLSK